jgi:hypothetical protein
MATKVALAATIQQGNNNSPTTLWRGRMRKVNFVFLAAIIAAPVHAQSTEDVVRGIGNLIGKVKPKKMPVPIQSPQPEPIQSPTTDGAPSNPSPDENVQDRFLTRKDAHGHDYDASSGYMICLDKPVMVQTSKYGSPQPTKIPPGHSSCISKDREFVTV